MRIAPSCKAELPKAELPRAPGDIAFADLSPPRKALIRLCQSINYGSIKNLQVTDAHPVFVPATRVLLDRKLDSAEPQRTEIQLVDFALSREVCRLMERLDELGTGTIQCIEVRAGIPQRITYERPLAL